MTTPDPPRNMVDVFSEVGHEPDTVFDVMDGGVLDNIPIGRAVQAIADAPATGLTPAGPHLSRPEPAASGDPAVSRKDRTGRSAVAAGSCRQH